MAEDGIVGQYNGSQAREVVITLADWERMQGLSSEPAPNPAVKPVNNANTLTTPRPKSG